MEKTYCFEDDNEDRHRDLIEIQIAWESPIQGKTNLCSDGSVHRSSGGAGAGCILRGDCANYIWAIALPMRSKDILTMEAQALELGTKIIEFEGREEVEI